MTSSTLTSHAVLLAPSNPAKLRLTQAIGPAAVPDVYSTPTLTLELTEQGAKEWLEERQAQMKWNIQKGRDTENRQPVRRHQNRQLIH